MNYITLFIGAAIMVGTGYINHQESIVAGGLVLMWIALSLV